MVVGARTDSAELACLREGYDVRFVAVDLATATGVRELIDEAVAIHGGIDILVNNVAMSEPAGSVTDFSDDQWQRIFDITFFSAVRTVRAAVPHMLGRSGAAIVNISSLTAKLPDGMIAPYSAAKAALTNVNKALAEDLTLRGSASTRSLPARCARRCGQGLAGSRTCSRTRPAPPWTT